MTIDIAAYLTEVQKIYATGQATEHSYRPVLEKLFKSIDPNVNAVNEPKGVKVGRPDFVFIREAGKNAQITVGHCEAKDIGLGINPKGMNDFNKAQHDRYVKALPNLVYTNGLDFRFYKNGELTREISIGEPLMGILPKPDQFSVLANQLKDFAAEKLQTITSAEKLAEMMAGKASLIKDILGNSLKDDKDLQTELTGQYQSFKTQLIHDLTAEDFADIYAETIAYGMFAARLHDTTLENFSREEALTLLPKSNPFLRNLFGYVAGPTLDERILRTIDELAEIFQATDLQKLFEDFGKFTQRNDPFIHFYETFLAKYNPAKRKARGVWYTPEPVVNFIVRAVDDVLKTEFGLADGLADTSKVTVKNWNTGQKDKKGNPVLTTKQVHRVQILDPAAGTGTFLAEVIKQIAPKVKDVAKGQWSTYVEKELIPRLHGFELLMASYAMCHMKLDMMLTELGYKPTGNPPRLGVYLTNSLEKGDEIDQRFDFAGWLSKEAKDANIIKQQMPIMCVIGNPPYSGVSQNDGDWITKKIEEYKYVDGVHFGERKHWLQDDYVKFLRLAEHMIEKNGEGVLGFITNHGYLDNPTFRGMRWHLLNTFNKIWILDLHGNSKKKEVAPNGSADKNVFDIQQGVAIIIAAKSKVEKIGLAEVKRADLWGTRAFKYERLWQFGIRDEKWMQSQPKSDYYFLANEDKEVREEYLAGFKLDELFQSFCTGIVSARDDLVVGYNSEELIQKLARFLNESSSDDQVRQEFFGMRSEKKYLKGDSRGWQLANCRKSLKIPLAIESIKSIQYRPFDFRKIAYTDKLVDWPRKELLGEFSGSGGIALLSPRMTADEYAPMVTKELISNKSASRYDQSYFFPLYKPVGMRNYLESNTINFDPKIHKTILAAVAGAAGSMVAPASPKVAGGGYFTR